MSLHTEDVLREKYGIVPNVSELCSDTVSDRFRSGPVRFLSYVFT